MSQPTCPRRPRLPLLRGVLAAVLLLGLLGAAASGGAQQARADPGDAPVFWTDPDSAAARQAAEWRQQGRTDDALLIDRIATRPQAVWFHDDEPGALVRAKVRAAAQAGRTAVLVAYFIPYRDCAGYSSGGARDAAHYVEWIDSFATGLGTTGAYVILEPDAVAHMVAGCEGADADERYALLAYAVERLELQAGTKVYLDAGNSGWIPDESRLVAPLRSSGIDRADGFALNVSNFRTDKESSDYGHRLAAALGGGTHFVIDSSRNGNGPYTGDEAWCNPPGRALGTPPTTDTGQDALDAYLWIKRPGESDGTCRGGPRAGQWWPEYALGLAERARG
ncbi:glycoside hydrolase family 6 protein [Streptomyces sp. G44]|uniref:glycoside hydrolase family 6 protein n=1 Tax=Streptomyces sp. G44 TaxID=2807632 RepID=UPI0019602DEA|nr:glycoside hydrolase family 6 protein [Streptomyces sp. G44]MBM7173564.1 glycoside hydrolase family 6 protein [Streptomyces sp. G44]